MHQEAERRTSWPGAPIDRVVPGDRERVLEVWEKSVRATHHFLTERDIEDLRPLVWPSVAELPHFICIRDGASRVLAFAGIDGEKMEALFVHPDRHGCGIGTRLTTHAIDELGVRCVDVNEQNEQAVAFYRRMGFVVESRSPLDGFGNAFPILHMRLSTPPALRQERRVVRDYRRTYDHPIAVIAGDRVVVGREDVEFPGWWWCVAIDGREGWIPIEVLEIDGSIAVARRSYSAVELTVRAETTVVIGEELHGWVWATTMEGESGWIPATHLDGAK